jgi:hypothetical protein
MMAGQREFILIDEQNWCTKRAFACNDTQSGDKQVVIVDGGPGTGKSIVP